MADGVELIPVDDQDIEERVFRGWEDGKGPQALSREFAIPIRRIEEIIDRMLPTFDAKNQLFAFKRELRRGGFIRRVLCNCEARQEPRERSFGRTIERKNLCHERNRADERANGPA